VLPDLLPGIGPRPDSRIAGANHAAMRYIVADPVAGDIMVGRSLLVIATVLLIGAAPLHAQSITNGTLDTNANGWTLQGGCVPSAWDGTIGNPPGSILMNSCGEAGSDPTAAQTISGLVVGATYTINVDVRLHVPASGAGTGKSFGIFLNTQPGNPLVFAEFLDSNWHTVTAAFTATSTSATVIYAAELDARTPGGPGSTTDVSYYIDNITLIAPATASASVPVPTTSDPALLALLLLLAIFAAVELRRGRGRDARL
jgi:hypothetical protein